jgi:DNA-binding HxlR family transcriptional regulator
MNINNSSKDDIIGKIGVFNKTKELGRILGFEGTTEIIYYLDEKPRQYKDLEKDLNIPHATLERRLHELQTVHIIKKKPITSNRRETHVYSLTPSGIELMKFINKYEKMVILPLSQQKIVEP